MRQGDVFWLTLQGTGSEPAGRRPAVVVQDDRFNRSALATTIVAAITSNLRLAAKPGNVRLAQGEANLPRPSVVNATQIVTVDRSSLAEPLGSLTPARTRQVVEGLAIVFGADRLAPKTP